MCFDHEVEVCFDLVLHASFIRRACVHISTYLWYTFPASDYSQSLLFSEIDQIHGEISSTAEEDTHHLVHVRSNLQVVIPPRFLRRAVDLHHWFTHTLASSIEPKEVVVLLPAADEAQFALLTGRNINKFDSNGEFVAVLKLEDLEQLCVLDGLVPRKHADDVFAFTSGRSLLEVRIGAVGSDLNSVPNLNLKRSSLVDTSWETSRYCSPVSFL